MIARLPARLTLLLILCLLPAVVCGGQSPRAEPLPWEALERDPGFTFGVQRFDDPDSDWQVDAFTLTSVLAQGERNRLYLRWRYLTLHTDGYPVFARWPDLVPDTEDEVAEDWPGESAVSGWGRPEIGLLAPMALPLLGAGIFCGEAALPFARNDLYPFASRSASLRFALNRPISLGPELALGLRAERAVNLGAAGEELGDAAFASRMIWGGALVWRPEGSGRRLELAGRVSGDALRRLGLTIAWPLGEDRRLEFGLLHNFADAADRLYRTRLQLGFSVGLAGADLGPDETGDRPPSPPRSPEGTQE